MNEIEHFKCPKGMFSLVEATYQRYYRGASETDFLLLIFILYHLREQIVGGQKYNQIKSINPQDRTPAQNLFMELWELDEFQIIREICNGTKHHKIEKDLSQIEKARAGIARSGDSLDQKYYLVPERKVMFRQNPNIKIRNSKQIRISNDKIIQTTTLEMRCFCNLNICILVIVSDFVLRISNF